jgi:NAD(P)H-dependent FMN reductase
MGNAHIEGKYRILLISGSLRKASTNTGLLRAAVNIGHPNLEFEWADISDFPLFNEDLEAQGVPKSVERVKAQVRSVQGILFGCPENNYSISAPLKNAYDWLSRDKDLLKGFPAAIVSSGGGEGGLRGQKALRTVGEYANVQFFSGSEIAVKRFGGNFFDADGNVTNEELKGQIKSFLQDFAAFTYKIRGGK